jgi:MerR family transcriptional regulator/heat shock protein HspR
VTRHDPVFGIGLAAEWLGVTPMALRGYERRGLVVPAKSPTGRRFYSLRDLDLMRCARELIVNEGLNIEGIRHLLGQIACWKVKRCSREERERCPVRLRPSGPCWSVPATPCRARQEDCRSCRVYRELPGCRSIKARLAARSSKEALHKEG